ncbi:MAG: hypothetical protein HKN48_02945 [Flavobacteriaceae bacterium]|nr:hypothetical protein [Flavobacteriaceae bacterium]
MKQFLIILFGVLLVTACSSNDDNNTENEEEQNQETGHFSLRINGDGFSDKLVELYRDTIDFSGRTLFLSSDDNGNSFAFYVDNPVEEVQYGMGPFDNFGNRARYGSDNGAVYSSGSGNVIIAEIITVNEICRRYKGNINVTLEKDSDPGSQISVQGSFDVPFPGCE